MSSAVEMNCLVLEAAETAVSPNWKDRVHAAARVLNLPFPRAKAFYYREHRRVTAEEMDNARAAIRALRDQRKRQREQEHLNWLASEIGRLEASGEEFVGPHVDGLKHFLRLASGADGTVALPETEPERKAG